jgi:hypothetical protein
VIDALGVIIESHDEARAASARIAQSGVGRSARSSGRRATTSANQGV